MAFDRFDRIASRTVDRTNAIPFVLTPMIQTPNGRPDVDLDRPVIEGRGIFDDVSSEYGVQLGVRKSYREANDLRSLQTGRDPQFSVDMKWFPTEDARGRQGDRISFPNKPDYPDFDVISAQPDGMARIVFTLANKGPQP